jgi:hypothetical protein
MTFFEGFSSHDIAHYGTPASQGFIIRMGAIIRVSLKERSVAKKG